MNPTGIQWATMTWNPTTGCTKVSPGCAHCYAERQFSRPYPGRAFGDVRVHVDRLLDPLRKKKPQRIFVDSMSDLFHDVIPLEFVARVFAVMALAHWHRFVVLTKRPERARSFFSWILEDYSRWSGANEPLDANIVLGENGRWIPDAAGRNSELSLRRLLEDHAQSWPLPNVELGVSVENDATARSRIDVLVRDLPAACRIVSYEPILGPVDFTPWIGTGESDQSGLRCGIDQVILGGESGPGARPCNLESMADAVRQLSAAGVPVFVKQLGARPGVPAFVTTRPILGDGLDSEDLEEWVESQVDTFYVVEKTATLAPAGFQPGPGTLLTARLPKKGGELETWPKALQRRELPVDWSNLVVKADRLRFEL